MGLSIDIAIEHDAWNSLGDLDALVRRAVETAVSEAEVEIADGTEMSLVLCDDGFMRNLNRNWRAKDRPTNVLSFPTDPSARAFTLGDIVLAYETLVREADDEQKSVADHLTHLVIHGTLHLLGHDHEADQEAELMERLEIQALRRLGIASPYEETAPFGATP